MLSKQACLALSFQVIAQAGQGREGGRLSLQRESRALAGPRRSQRASHRPSDPSLRASQPSSPPASQLSGPRRLSLSPPSLSTAMSSRYTVGPTETERCIESLLAVFQRYAGRDGDASALTKKEFLTFMNTELASFSKSQKDPAILDRMMKKLDMNCDGKIDFGEFLNLIGGMAQACHAHVLSSPTGGLPQKP
ncbi:protein S100-A11 [Rhineura floridana]|uniref:protein S100-A11 n=1 Tax=Rhineura floridana TaxID=261503 RepID=UPI002AC84C14|nr:protein S100-A11 [Rhineura floridana]